MKLKLCLCLIFLATGCSSARPPEPATTAYISPFRSPPVSPFGAARQPVAVHLTNLLTNPGFEGDYVVQDGIGEVSVAPGWRAWFFDHPPCNPRKYPGGCYVPCPSNCVEPSNECKPGWDEGCYWARPEFVPITYSQAPYRVRTGDKAQKYFTYGRMHEAGMYQQVNVTPGTLIEFSAWIQTWMCYHYPNCDGGQLSDFPSDMHVRIGIDPSGGTVPTSTTIIWSAEAPAFDQWTHFSVQARALTHTVTVFTHSRPVWDWARNNNDVYIDDAALVVVESPEPTITPSPTTTPGPTPTSRPQVPVGWLPLVADSAEGNAWLAPTPMPAPTITPTGLITDLTRARLSIVPSASLAMVGDVITLTVSLGPITSVEAIEIELVYPVSLTAVSIATATGGGFEPAGQVRSDGCSVYDLCLRARDGHALIGGPVRQVGAEGGTLAIVAFVAVLPGRAIVEPVNAASVFVALAGGGAITPRTQPGVVEIVP